MARLGELLVAAQLLTSEQIEQALRAQVMWGGRLGTNLIELGLIDLDLLSSVLGKQHRMPAAFARHFEQADAELQHKLTRETAETYSVVPLMRLKIGKIVIAALEPLDATPCFNIANELDCDPEMLVQSVAGELRILYQLERIYGVARGARFMRARGRTQPPPTLFSGDLDVEDSQVSSPLPEQRATLRALHDQAIAETGTQPAPVTEPPPPVPVIPSTATSEPIPALDVIADDLSIANEPTEAELVARRKYVPMIDEPAKPEQTALGRIAIRRVTLTTAPASQTLGEATRAIRRSTDRDRVAELVCTTLERFQPSCDAGILLVVRGDVAIGWKGFCRGGALGEVAVPLNQVGLVPSAISRGFTMRAPACDLGEIDNLLFSSLGGSGDRELIVVPVTIAGNVMLTIALITDRAATIRSAESIAAATGAAFARLMRDASR